MLMGCLIDQNFINRENNHPYNQSTVPTVISIYRHVKTKVKLRGKFTASTVKRKQDQIQT